MRYHPKTLLWAVALALGLFLASAPAAHAQQCRATCNANVDCSTSCVNGLAVVGEPINYSTCGDAGFPCCNTTVTTTADCTAQFLNSNYTCVYVTRSFVTTTCGSNSNTVIDGHRDRTDNSNCQACPTFHTPGCEDVGPSPYCG
jgi:hypothetical protein